MKPNKTVHGHPKRSKPIKQAHVAKPRKMTGDSHGNFEDMGVGDYYGTGRNNPMGKVIEGNGLKPISKKKIGTPPKSVV